MYWMQNWCIEYLLYFKIWKKWNPSKNLDYKNGLSNFSPHKTKNNLCDRNLVIVRRRCFTLFFYTVSLYIYNTHSRAQDLYYSNFSIIRTPIFQTSIIRTWNEETDWRFLKLSERNLFQHFIPDKRFKNFACLLSLISGFQKLLNSRILCHFAINWLLSLTFSCPYFFLIFSSKEVDLGVDPLTLTYERFSVVDYTQPYMEDGMSILMKRPDGKQSDLLQSYRVFAESTWLAFAVSFILSFIILTIVNKGSAYIRGKNKVPKPTRSYKYNFWLMFGYSLQEGQ